MLSKIFVLGALLSAAGSSVTGGPSGTDWQGLATFISAIGSLIGAGVAAYVALRRRDTTEEMLLKLLTDKDRKESEDTNQPPRRRRIGRKR